MNRRDFIRTAAVGTAVGTLSTGCIGSFALTDKVFQFNRGLGGIVVQEVVFLAFCIVPIYEITLFVDAIVLNTIEAFTGGNPLASAPRESSHVALASEVDLFLSPEEDVLETELVEGVRRTVRRFHRRSDGLEVTDEQGAVIARATVDGVSGLKLADIYGEELAVVSLDQLEQAGLAFEAGGSRGLTDVVMALATA